jgi:hypothetical protein
MMSKLNATTFGGIGLGPNSDGQFQIGGTYATAGDVSNAAAGDGVTLTAAKPFALAVYADDGGTAIASSWASAGFFSYINFAAQAAGSAMALTGQVHIGANFTAGDNIAGVYGVTECDSAKTINAHVFGGLFGVSCSAGTVGASYRVAAIQTGVNMTGATVSGTQTHINFLGGTGGTATAAMSFGTIANDMTGSGADKVADVSETPLGHILVYLGNTLGYVNVYSDAT